MIRNALSLSAVLFITAAAIGDHWPTFRGPERTGVSQERSTPAAWSERDRDNVTWSAKLPGGGDSSPVVWNDRVFVCAISEMGDRRLTLALDRRTGAIEWTGEAEVEAPVGDAPQRVSTPATDGSLVYAWHGSQAVAAYTIEGREVWRTDPEPERETPDASGSPLLWQDLLINVSGPGGEPHVIALDRRTGERVWRADLSGIAEAGESRGEAVVCSPIVIDNAGSPELIVVVPGWIVSLNPQSGREYWRCGGLGRSIVASPAAGAGLIVAGSVDGTLVAVAVPDAGHRGDVTSAQRRWRIEPGSPMRSSPVLLDPMLFSVDAAGVLTCRDAGDGSLMWTHDMGAPVQAPLIIANQWVYVTDVRGTTHILAARTKRHEIGSGSPAEPRGTHAAPAFSDGQMFLRTESTLYCVGVRVKP